jgi:hypothetical protein
VAGLVADCPNAFKLNIIAVANTNFFIIINLLLIFFKYIKISLIIVFLKQNIIAFIDFTEIQVCKLFFCLLLQKK